MDDCCDHGYGCACKGAACACCTSWIPWASYDLGKLLGLRAAASLIPPMPLLLAFSILALRFRTSAPT